jgi:Carboxypeptidase regulatory-like domain/TonB-dependent Receptor Plug Domain
MNALKRVFQVLLAFVLLGGITPAGLMAQTSNGTIAGVVVDAKDNVLPKADVKAISPQFGALHQTQTDSAGTYRLESLQPGVYNVTISLPGLAPLEIANVVVNGSVTTTVNGTLQLAAVQNVIEIQAPASQVIDTQSGQMGTTINRQEIAQIPYSSLNPAELAMTLPGVHDTPGGQGAVDTSFTEGVEFSVNGTRPRANNFLIDGQDDNDYGITGQAYQPSNAGNIQEVTILTNAYAAEYGRGGGSVTNYILKSGTNNYHGDLWEINRNSALAGIPAQDEVGGNGITKNPYDNENTFGFDVGGPVIKDKLFAFGAAQWDRERQSVTGPLFKLPTAAGIQTLKTSFPNNANVNLLLNSIGNLVSPGLGGLQSVPTTLLTMANPTGCPCVQIGFFQVQNVTTASNAYDWNYRMDWQISDRDILTGSVVRDSSALSPDNFANPDALPNFQTQQGGPTGIYRGQWVHTLSPTLVNELRMSYTSINFGFNLTPKTAASPLANTPNISFGSDIDFPSIGVDSGFPQGRGHKTWQIQDSISHTAGKHSLKVGADITIVHADDVLPLNTRGSITYNFDHADGYNSLGDFILDQTGQDPGTIAKGFGNPNLTTKANMFALFVQDAWRIRNNLTLTGGLRYEYWGALANSLPFPAFDTSAGVGLPNAMDPSYSTSLAKYETLFSFKQVPDKRNFAPRLGIAYTPHWGGFLTGAGKTTFRAGYGIFYDGLFTNILDNSAELQPNTLGGSATGLTGAGKLNASTFPGIGPTLNSTLFTESMASHLHNPFTQQWNVDVQRELPLGLVLTLAYVGTRGERLFANQDFNPQDNYSYINPNFGELGVRTNVADSWYNSGQLEVERKIHTVVLRAAYTYSKFMDDSSEVFAQGTSSANSGLASYPQVLTNQKSDWGPSIFDQRQRFNLAYVWELPYFKHNTFLKILTDRWQWSGNATFDSGMPSTVEVGFDNIGNGHANSRPDLGNPAAPLNSFGIDGGDIGFPAGTYDFTCLFLNPNPCNPGPFPISQFHFVIPNTVPGNVGRNSLIGPGQLYFDTAVERDIPLHFWKMENQELQFRADFFNAFNHPNLYTPSYNMFDPNFNNTAITINGGREIKIWMKLTF